MKPRAMQEVARDLKRRLILHALAVERGNRTRAARRLGYSCVANLWRAIQTLDLNIPEGKRGRPRGKVKR